MRIDAVGLDPASRDRAEHRHGLVPVAEVSDHIGHPSIDTAHGDIAQRLKAAGGFLEIGEDAVDAVGGRRRGDLVETDFRAVELDAADLEALLPVAHAVPQAGDGHARIGIKGARQERHPVLVLPGRERRDVARGTSSASVPAAKPRQSRKSMPKRSTLSASSL